MIVSPDNERLKLARKLRERKWRKREGAFVTEGEDLLLAGLRAGRAPREVLLAPGVDVGVRLGVAVEVEPDLLDAASALGSGTRVIAVWPIPEPEGGEAGPGSVYLHGVGDPGNVGTIVRTAAALTGGTVILGPGSADAYAPKAVRATMGAIFARPPLRGGIGDVPRPRLGLLAHGGEPLGTVLEGMAAGGVGTLCLGSEREGLPEDVAAACEATATIPLRPGAESLNVAAAAAIGLQGISSLSAAGGG